VYYIVIAAHSAIRNYVLMWNAAKGHSGNNLSAVALLILGLAFCHYLRSLIGPGDM
jgi:hypothetical protein